jgi:hypothetical protein
MNSGAMLWVVNARSPMGPRIATPVAAKAGRCASATGGSTPLATALIGPAAATAKKFSVNQKPKSVTHVLNHRCYLCPDCALRQLNIERPTSNAERATLTEQQQPPKTTAHIQVARWFVIAVLSLGLLLVVFLRQPNVPEVVLLPPATTIQYNPVPDRWIPHTWGWMWRLRDLLLGRRAPVDFDAFILRPVEPALAADLERLAAPTLATNGIRIWSMPTPKFDNAAALARKSVANKPDAIASRINTADGFTATLFNGNTIPIAGSGFADIGFQLQVLPRTRKRATDLTFKVKWTEMLDRPQPIDPGATNIGPIICTNLWQAARVQVPVGNGIVIMQSPSETQPGVLLLLSVGRK